MPSTTYRLFKQAIMERRQVTCTYLGKRREVCPHILGYKDGEEKALVFQFAGQTTSELPPGGEWRCLSLKRVSGAQSREGPWHAGERHRRTQACIDIVDVDVNIEATLGR